MALAAATNMKDVLQIRDKAEAIRVYTKAIGESLHAQNAAAEIKLRAERKAGELLRDTEKAKPGRPQKNGSTMEPITENQPTLEDLGIGKTQSHRWQREASVPEEVFEAHVARCANEQIELTQASVLQLAGAGHVAQATGDNEWYTPPQFIEAARQVMGEIDLDPASSEKAQEIVKAKRFYTLADDGLSHSWSGRVWLNPPYSKDLCARFAAKLIESKRVSQACVLVNNATETAWLQSLFVTCDSACFPAGRIRFLNRSGQPANSPLQGQVILYFGDQATLFRDTFREFGATVCGDVSQ